jgi:uncharacterized OB-fold protein
MDHEFHLGQYIQTKEARLHMTGCKCANCGNIQYPPKPVCYVCSENKSNQQSSEALPKPVSSTSSK